MGKLADALIAIVGRSYTVSGCQAGFSDIDNTMRPKYTVTFVVEGLSDAQVVSMFEAEATRVQNKEVRTGTHGFGTRAQLDEIRTTRKHNVVLADCVGKSSRSAQRDPMESVASIAKVDMGECLDGFDRVGVDMDAMFAEWQKRREDESKAVPIDETGNVLDAQAA